jgi:hypothetical protein
VTRGDRRGGGTALGALRRGALVKVGRNWYRMIGVLAPDAVGASQWAGEDTNPAREVYLPITHTFAPDAFRRQSLAAAWLAVAAEVDREAAALRFDR